MKNSPKIIIDLVTIVPGKGGSGGGIWTYARHLLYELDRIIKPGDILLLVNNQFAIEFINIKVQTIGFRADNDFYRLIWNHLLLPLRLLKVRKPVVLHKPATEIPVWSPVPVITTIHDFMNEFYYESGKYKSEFTFREKLISGYFRFMAYWSLKKSAAIIVPTRSIQDEAIHRYPFCSKKVVPIYEASDLQGFHDGGKHNRTPEPVKIIYVGAFYRHKGQLRFIKFLRSVFNKRPELKTKLSLTFHGHLKDKKYWSEFEHELNDIGCHTELSKYNPEKSMTDLYLENDICVSFSEYEGFGLPVIEAQSLGLAVCCSNLEVFKEILGKTALILDLKNQEQAVELFINLIEDEKVRLNYSSSGKLNAAKFSWLNAAQETLSLYNRVANHD